jgi:hypothetical protein
MYSIPMYGSKCGSVLPIDLTRDTETNLITKSLDANDHDHDHVIAVTVVLSVSPL